MRRTMETMMHRDAGMGRNLALWKAWTLCTGYDPRRALAHVAVQMAAEEGRRQVASQGRQSHE